MYARAQRRGMWRQAPFLLYYLWIGVALLIIARLYYHQVIEGAPRTAAFGAPKEKIFERGDIYFVDKDGTRTVAATTYYGKNLAISPRELGDVEETFEHILTEFPVERDVFFAKAARAVQGDGYEIIATRIPEDAIRRLERRIDRFGLQGVFLEDQAWRTYPYDELGSHVLGFVAFSDSGTYAGQYGLEHAYDFTLSRPAAHSINSYDIFLNDLQGNASPTAGGSIVTFIDPNVQMRLENTLRQIQQNTRSQKVGGLVMNPRNGSIVAMAARPSFDPNTFFTLTEYSLFNNPLIEEVYEMGSVFKPLTVAIGLDSGAITVRETYTDRGSLEIDGETISNYDNRGRGANVSLQTIINQSLNTGAAHIMLKTGRRTFGNYMSAFRFDDPTGVDLPREIGGLVSNLKSTRDIEFVTASYGHGIAVTPLAATRAFATLANGGYRVRPRIVQGAEGQGAVRRISNKQQVDKIFRKETTDIVTNLLVHAYDHALAGGAFRNPRYSIAAKTGTAQMLDTKKGVYIEDKFLHSFFGYFPASDPHLLTFLYAVDPKSAQFASETLAGPFSALTNALITYYHIPPDR